MNSTSATAIRLLEPQFPERRPAELRQVVKRLQSANPNEIRLGVHDLARWAAGEECVERAVFPLFFPFLEHEDSDVRETAEYGFSEFGEWAFEELMRLVEENPRDSAARQISLIRALGNFVSEDDEGSASQRRAIARLEAARRDSDPDVRGAATKTSALLGHKSPEFVRQLAEMCRSPHVGERRGAVEALAHIAEESPTFAKRFRPIFLDLLGEPDEKTQEAIAWALARDDVATFSSIVDKIQSGDSSIRAHGFVALSRFSESLPIDKRLVRELCFSSLHDSEKSVRIAAAYCIRVLCSDDCEAIPRGDSASLWDRVTELFGKWISQPRNSANSPTEEASKKIVSRAEVLARLGEMAISPYVDERKTALHAAWCILSRQAAHDADLETSSVETLHAAILENRLHRNEELRKWALDLVPSLAISEEQKRDFYLRGLVDPSLYVSGSVCKIICALAESENEVTWAVPALEYLLKNTKRDDSQIHSPFEYACRILRQLPPSLGKNSATSLLAALDAESSNVVVEAAITLAHLN